MNRIGVELPACIWICHRDGLRFNSPPTTRQTLRPAKGSHVEPDAARVGGKDAVQKSPVLQYNIRKQSRSGAFHTMIDLSPAPAPDAPSAVPDARGRYGAFGGRFVPETLIPALDELAAEYERAKSDPAFQREMDYYLRDFVGRATPLYHAERLSQQFGARIYLKREDLCHTG